MQEEEDWDEGGDDHEEGGNERDVEDDEVSVESIAIHRLFSHDSLCDDVEHKRNGDDESVLGSEVSVGDSISISSSSKGSCSSSSSVASIRKRSRTCSAESTGSCGV